MILHSIPNTISKLEVRRWAKKFAPSYANIFMAEWETGALARCTKKPLHYFRFLDDIFGIWTYSQLDFQNFIDTLNSHDPSIKIKFEISESSIDFLETSVFKGPEFNSEQQLHTKIPMHFCTKQAFTQHTHIKEIQK